MTAYDAYVEKAVEALLPHGAGPVTDTRLRAQMQTVAQQSYQAGYRDALMGLRTAEEMAEKFGVTVRRMRAIIANRHSRFGTGRKLGHTWVVSAQEVESVKPDAKYQRK